MFSRKEETALIAWLKNHFHPSMTRALIYKVFSRGILALFAAQLVHFFARGMTG